MPATHEVTNNHLFPVGTEVGIYLGTSVTPPYSGEPNAAPIDVQTMTATGVTFTGLAYRTDYVAAGEVAGVWRFEFVNTGPAPTGLPGGPLQEGDYGGSSIPVGALQFDPFAPLEEAIEFAIPDVTNFSSPQSHRVLRAEFVPLVDRVAARLNWSARCVGEAQCVVAAYDGPASALPFVNTQQSPYPGGALPDGVTVHMVGAFAPGLNWSDHLGLDWEIEAESGEDWAVELAIGIVGGAQAQNTLHGRPLGDGPGRLDVTRSALNVQNLEAEDYLVTRNNGDDTASVVRVGWVEASIYDQEIARLDLPASASGDVACGGLGIYAAVSNPDDNSVSILNLPGLTAHDVPSVAGRVVMADAASEPTGVLMAWDESTVFVIEKATGKLRVINPGTLAEAASATGLGTNPLRGCFTPTPVTATHIAYAINGEDKLGFVRLSDGLVTKSGVLVGAGSAPVACAADANGVWVALQNADKVVHVSYDGLAVDHTLDTFADPIDVKVSADGLSLFVVHDTAVANETLKHFSLEDPDNPITYTQWGSLSGGAAGGLVLTEPFSAIYMTIPGQDALDGWMGSSFNSLDDNPFWADQAMLTIEGARVP